jgi:hypothetical protein
VASESIERPSKSIAIDDRFGVQPRSKKASFSLIDPDFGISSTSILGVVGMSPTERHFARPGECADGEVQPGSGRKAGRVSEFALPPEMRAGRDDPAAAAAGRAVAALVDTTGAIGGCQAFGRGAVSLLLAAE